MHPDNLGCIVAAEIDCCVLANNHVADWGPGGLKDTLTALQQAGISTAGAGKNAEAAARPAILEQTYEGILCYEEFHPDMAVGYFLDIDERGGGLLGLQLVPFRIQKFRLVRASARDALWIAETLDRECLRFGGRVRLTGDNALAFSW